MASEWPTATVSELQRNGVLLVEDGNHGEYRPRPDEFVDAGVAFIRAADIEADYVNFEAASRINDNARKRITKGIGAPGDILLSHKGTVGKVALVPHDAPPFVCSPQTTFWRTLDTSTLDRNYLFAFLRSPGFHAQLATRAGETDMAPYVSLTSQRGFSVALPPVAVQRDIANVVGTLDDKINLNRRMNETLEATARALFKSWFVDFDPVRTKIEGQSPGIGGDSLDVFPNALCATEWGEIPVGWRIVPLSTFCAINPQRSLRKDERAPYVDMASIPTKGHSPASWIERPYGSGSRFQNGDTLVARITPCLENGKTAYVDILKDGEVGWGSTEYIVLRPLPPLPSEYAYCLARSEPFRDNAIRSMTGSSGRQRVPVDAVANFRVAEPPKPIAEAFGKIVSPLFARMKEAATETRILTNLRDSLLPRLISGQLRLDRI
jgi:type I restriction enzyme S subunit